MTTSNAERWPEALRFWLGWTLVNTVGVSIGLVLSIGFMLIAGIFVSSVGHSAPGSWAVMRLFILMVLGGAGILGLFVGVCQGWMLRRRVSTLGWMLASIGGSMLGGVPALFVSLLLAGRLPNMVLAFTAGGLLMGAGIGVVQWLAIRDRVPRAGWWIAASAIASLIVSLIMSVVLPVTLGPISTLVTQLLTALLIAVTFSAVTGGAWVWLMGQPPPRQSAP